MPKAPESPKVQAAALQAKADQVAAMRKAEQAGDSFAAYWAASASASVAHHARRGAVVIVKGGK